MEIAQEGSTTHMCSPRYVSPAPNYEMSVCNLAVCQQWCLSYLASRACALLKEGGKLSGI